MPRVCLGRRHRQDPQHELGRGRDCLLPLQRRARLRALRRIHRRPRIAKGDHPAIALSSKELEHVIESGGQWADVKSQQLPKLEKGVAYFKTKRTMTENLAYAAAAGNKGCYVGLFVVLFVIIFLIVSFFIFR